MLCHDLGTLGVVSEILVMLLIISRVLETFWVVSEIFPVLPCLGLFGGCFRDTLLMLCHVLETFGLVYNVVYVFSYKRLLGLFHRYS